MRTGFCCHFKGQVFTEYHNDIVASEQELSERITLSDLCAFFDLFFKID